MNRVVYIVENELGETIDASTDVNEARDHGEMLQTYFPEHEYYLTPVTLQ